MIYWALFLLIFGMVFAIFEILIPGFGFFGVTSIILFILSWIITICFVPYGLFIVLIELVLITAFGFKLFKYFKSRNLKGTIILDETLAEDEKEDYKNFLFKVGIAKTPLKPFGKGEFNGSVIDVCAESFIDKGKSIKAVKYDDGKIYVREI